MKKISVFLLTVICLCGYSQYKPKEVCHVTHINGIIRKPGNLIIAKNDTVLLANLGKLKFETKDAFVAIFSFTYGCVKIGQNEALRLNTHKDNFLILAAELMEIKGTTVPLYSRGDCKCLNPNSCFTTDTLLNNKVLAFDSIMFHIDPAISNEIENCVYFTQFVVGQKKFTKYLTMKNSILITAASLLLFTISCKKDTDGNKGKQLIDVVSKVRFNFCEAKDVYDYYLVLQNLMRGYSTPEIYNEFTRSVYSIYGKPDLCCLNKLINR